MATTINGGIGIDKVTQGSLDEKDVASKQYANSLLAEFEVTGSPVTSVEFDNLDINTHSSYRAEIEAINATSSEAGINMFVNEDFTQSNYEEQYLFVNGTSISYNRESLPYVNYMTGSQKSSCVIHIHNLGSSITAEVQMQRFNSVGGAQVQLYSYKHKNTVANLTKLTFSTAVANALAVGSKIRLYRGDV